MHTQTLRYFTYLVFSINHLTADVDFIAWIAQCWASLERSEPKLGYSPLQDHTDFLVEGYPTNYIYLERKLNFLSKDIICVGIREFCEQQATRERRNCSQLVLDKVYQAATTWQQFHKPRSKWKHSNSRCCMYGWKGKNLLFPTMHELEQFMRCCPFDRSLTKPTIAWLEG